LQGNILRISRVSRPILFVINLSSWYIAVIELTLTK
jgi:hypothetical protein